MAGSSNDIKEAKSVILSIFLRPNTGTVVSTTRSRQESEGLQFKFLIQIPALLIFRCGARHSTSERQFLHLYNGDLWSLVGELNEAMHATNLASVC